MDFTFNEFFNLFEPDETYTLDAYDRYYHNEINGAFFRINKKTFLVTENPEDGYRSSLGSILNTPHNFENVFQPIKVHINKKDDDIIQMVNVSNGLTIFEFGTNYSDSWYPSFVCDFNPENIGEVRRERQIKSPKPSDINSNLLL